MSSPFPSGYSASGSLPVLGNANFGNFRPQYSLPGSGQSGQGVQMAFPGVPANANQQK